MIQDPSPPTRLRLKVSPRDPLPIYAQIVNQVGFLVASGTLKPGDELPPIRVLAEQLLVNPNTVAQAYRKLEEAGVVEKRRTQGTYVSDTVSPLADAQRRKILGDKIESLLVEAKQLNFSVDEVVDMIRHSSPVPETTTSDKRSPAE